MQDKSITIVKVFTAHRLDNNQVGILKGLIKQKLGNKYQLEEVVDPTHLGGIKLSLGKQEYDLTIAGALKKVKTQTMVIEVTSCLALTTPQLARLRSGLEKRYGNGLAIKQIVDSSLVGGIRLRLNNIEYDGSIATKLAKLLSEFKNNL